MDIYHLFIDVVLGSWFGIALVTAAIVAVMVLAKINLDKAERDDNVQFGGAEVDPTSNTLPRSEVLTAGLAAIGRDATPDQTLGTYTLRTTFGMRLVPIAVTILFTCMVWPAMTFDPITHTVPSWGQAAQWLIFPGGVGLYALAIFNYKVMVDDTGMVAPRYLVFRRKYAWKNLVDFRLSSSMQFTLRFEPGGDIRVYRHLVGINELVSRASNAVKVKNMGQG